MTHIAGHDGRVEVWESLAEHFLDTETRHRIPHSALCCLQAGLGIVEARDVWRYEVSPAVAFNLWCVAGEWAGWNRDSLVEEITRVRSGWLNRTGAAKWLRYRARVLSAHGVWLSIERCMGVLLGLGEPSERESLVSALTFVASHFFDLPSYAAAIAAAGGCSPLGCVHPEPFGHVFAPVILRDEILSGEARVRAALANRSAVESLQERSRRR
ncbi:MAG TPA: hypothetical protein VER33_02845 [Polyangiaceae bacterium]|nr:hypothetical protein [Polyangiaceae bacterium]